MTQYYDNGWVELEGLVSTDLAAIMLERAKQEILETPVDGQKYHDLGQWRDRFNLGRDDLVEPFSSAIRSQTMGRNAQRLMRRDVLVGLVSEGSSACKSTCTSKPRN